MILIDGRAYDVSVRGTPRFPAALDGRYEAAVVAAETPDDADAFLAWFTAQCRARQLSKPRDVTENIVHARRLVMRHTLADLKRLAAVFFNNFAEPLEDRRYAHHLRLFVHELPNCQDLLSRYVAHEED